MMMIRLKRAKKNEEVGKDINEKDKINEEYK